MNFKRLLSLAVFSCFASLLSQPAFAECGGQVQCIGIGPTEAYALTAHHDNPNAPSTPIFAFGSLDVATTSTPQTIFVTAVTGPPGEMAMLGPITITGADASEFSISGGNCSTTNGPVHGGALCTIEIIFSPVTLGPKSATLNVPLNPPACASCITGRTALLAGVGGAVDLSTDAVVAGMNASQAQTVRRFSRAQISNVQTRFDSLHGNNSRRDFGATNVINDGGILSLSGARGSATDILSDPAIQLPETPQEDQSTTVLARELFAALSSKSVDLSYSNNISDLPLASSGGIGLWLEGNINFGTRGATVAGANNYQTFTTDGLSIGVDRRFNEQLTLGLGLGLGNDRTTIGSNGSRSKSEATSYFVYASYELTRNLFFDALVGSGSLSFDLDRYVASTNSYERGQRDGEQMFGSIAASYDFHDETLLLSPYVRLDFMVDKLDGYTETGASANAITYSKDSFRSNQFSLGIRVESTHKTYFGWATPQFRAEWSQNSEDDRQNTMVYANQPASAEYILSTIGEDEDSLLLGMGSDFIYPGGLRAGVHYSLSRASDQDSDQTIGFSLLKDLDDKAFMPESTSEKTFNNPLQLEASYLQSDNLNQASNAADELSDQMYRVKISSRSAYALSRHSRIILRVYLGADRLHRYYGLNKNTLGAKAELQYKSSGAFDAVTLGLFGDFAYDDYDSALRTGDRYDVGFTARQSFTDKISVFGAIQNHTRNADNTVFDAGYNAVRLIADYYMGRSGTFYLGAQLRKGDLTVSTPVVSYYNDIAVASAADDGFSNQPLTATRFDAQTNIWTLGYNWPLGIRDSVDFNWMKIKSTPTGNASNAGYSNRQLSLAYIMRF